MATFGKDIFGAWVLKCNPKKYDLAGFLDDGHTRISSWSVRDNERSRGMAEGEPVVLWVSGTSKRMPRGVWGIGKVTGPLLYSSPDEYWLDDYGPLFRVVEIDVRELLVGADVVKVDPVLVKSELIAAPQMSNPALLSMTEWSALRRLLPRRN